MAKLPNGQLFIELTTGGLIVATAGAQWVFGINGATFVVSALCLARISVPGRERGQSRAFWS